MTLGIRRRPALLLSMVLLAGVGCSTPPPYWIPQLFYADEFEPLPGAVTVPLHQTIAVSFSDRIDPSSVKVTNAYLRADGEGQKKLALSVHPNDDRKLVWNDNTVPLDAGTRYWVNLETSLMSADGEPLVADVEYTFTTAGQGSAAMITPVEATGESARKVGSWLDLSGWLEGAESTDDAEYMWSVVSSPSSAIAYLDDPNAEVTGFCGSDSGVYVVSLVITVDWVPSAPAYVRVELIEGEGGDEDAEFVEVDGRPTCEYME